jgi:hypothetical protein
MTNAGNAGSGRARVAMVQRAPSPLPSAMTCAAACALACAAALLLVAQARGDDRADLERTRIIGNRELPKVLYIVPWKKPLPGELSGRPFKSVLDEVLAPIDRDVFRRQVNYVAQIPPAGAPAPENK